MRSLTIGILILASSVLAGCGGFRLTSNVETACKLSVEKRLMNPETSEFLDFAKTDRVGILDAVANITRREVGSDYDSLNQQAARNIVGAMEANDPGIQFFTARVRAEGQLGNTITKSAACFGSKDPLDCQCIF